MPTPIGTTSAYALVTDLENYRDWRQMADWISTNDQRGTQGDFESNAIPGVHLLQASGRIETAVLKGGRYAVADMQALTGASLQTLVWLTVWLAIETMSKFKTRTKGDDNEIDKANELLKQLETGERVFALYEQAVDANLPESIEVYEPGQKVSEQAHRMFGDRARSRGRWDF